VLPSSGTVAGKCRAVTMQAGWPTVNEHESCECSREPLAGYNACSTLTYLDAKYLNALRVQGGLEQAKAQRHATDLLTARTCQWAPKANVNLL
jgi:hypothetical protein